MKEVAALSEQRLDEFVNAAVLYAEDENNGAQLKAVFLGDRPLHHFRPEIIPTKYLDDVKRNLRELLQIFARRETAELQAELTRSRAALLEQWRCFHCDEVFTDRREAWLHFGDENCETDPPACIDPLRTDEQARLKELREARAHALKMQYEMEEVRNDADLLQQYREEIGRLFGMVGGVKASTPQQAWLVLDSEHGKVLAAEAALLEVERRLAKATDILGEIAAYGECECGDMSSGALCEVCEARAFIAPAAPLVEREG